MFRQFLRVLFLCLLVQSCFAAEGLITERAYFEDTSKELTIEQVKQQVFIPYQSVLTERFSDSAYWLRFTIDPSRDSSSLSNTPLIMLIRPSFLDEIQLYDAFDDMLSPKVTGDAVDALSKTDSLSNSLFLTFTIPRGVDPRYVWLRLKTTSPILVDVDVYNPEEFNKLTRQRELFYSFNIAVLVCFIIWAFFHWTVSYENLIQVFLIKQMLSLIWFLCTFGYIRLYLDQYLSATAIDTITNVSIIIYCMSAFYFDYLLFKELHPLKQGSKVLLFLMACLPIMLLLMAFGFTMWALKVNFFITIIASIYSMLVAIRLTKQSKSAVNQSPLLSKKLLVVAYFLICVLVNMALFSALGFLNAGTEIILDVRVAHAVVTGVLMVYLLYIRSQHLEHTHRSKLLEMTIKEHEIDAERKLQLEKSGFLGMLAHDLKSPLAVAKAALGSKHLSDTQINFVNQAVDDMNNVIERCLQVSELEEKQIPLTLVTINLAQKLLALKLQTVDAERIKINVHNWVTLHSDNELLSIILANLLDNANKYSRPRSLIVIDVNPINEDQLSGVEISIFNTPGIAGWPDSDKVFQKYYRGQQARHITGAGQGLYLASRLAKILGGHIRYAPTQTHICFNLWLPN